LNLRLRADIYKGLGITGRKKIQFPYENIDRELRACITESNLFVICLLIQFKRESGESKPPGEAQMTRSFLDLNRRKPLACCRVLESKLLGDRMNI
jgi:hypothetical protein